MEFLDRPCLCGSGRLFRDCHGQVPRGINWHDSIFEEYQDKVETATSVAVILSPIGLRSLMGIGPAKAEHWPVMNRHIQMIKAIGIIHEMRLAPAMTGNVSGQVHAGMGLDVHVKRSGGEDWLFQVKAIRSSNSGLTPTGVVRQDGKVERRLMYTAEVGVWRHEGTVTVPEHDLRLWEQVVRWTGRLFILPYDCQKGYDYARWLIIVPSTNVHVHYGNKKRRQSP